MRFKLLLLWSLALGNHHVELLAELIPASWEPAGRGPIYNGQTEGILLGPNPVSGAIHAVLANPNDANVLYVGSVNGGVWKTTNALAEKNIDWTPLTDFQASLSIGAMTWDLADPTWNSIIAGIGRYSSFSRLGGDRTGLLKTTNGGRDWTSIDGGLHGKNISGVVARGNDIVVSVNSSDDFSDESLGVFRSGDGGLHFSQLSRGDGHETGLPSGVSYDLVSDPRSPNRLYASIAFSDEGANGIYRSDDFGVSWELTNTRQISNLVDGSVSNIELAVGLSGEVYTSILDRGVVVGMFRSPDGLPNSWQPIDIPSTNENGVSVGLNPRGFIQGETTPEQIAGGQGSTHFSIMADPHNANLVYVGGDRQPRSNGDKGSFPNAIGANNFTGRLFRGDTSLPNGSQFVHITHSSNVGPPGGGTRRNSAPHADSRDMTFDAQGRLIEVDDGGIYYRSNPTGVGDWFSLNGDLQIGEYHSIAYDSLTNRIFVGSQDNGTQMDRPSGDYSLMIVGDGGDVAIDNTSRPGFSTHYISAQELLQFTRQVFGSNGVLESSQNVALRHDRNSPAVQGQSITPLAINRVDGNRLLIGAANGVFESYNQGDDVTLVEGDKVNLGSLIYGGFRDSQPYPDVAYVGTGSLIWKRQNAQEPFEPIETFPGEFIRGLDINEQDWTQLFAADSNHVFRSLDAGETFADITSNLHVSDIRSIRFMHIPSQGDSLLIGAREGVFLSLLGADPVWWELGANTLPNAPIRDMSYDRSDDLLVIATLGRGAWRLPNASRYLIPEPTWHGGLLGLIAVLGRWSRVRNATFFSAT